MSEDQNTVVTLKVRVSPEFREKIVATAKENNRSMNQEIVARLEKSFEDPVSFNPNDAEMMTKIVALSMQTLISELKNEGVEGEKLSKAIHNVANKKAP